jgi:hypothetical protein
MRSIREKKRERTVLTDSGQCPIYPLHLITSFHLPILSLLLSLYICGKLFKVTSDSGSGIHRRRKL